MYKVQFHFGQKNTSLKERKRLKRFIEKMFSEEGKSLKMISYVFCSDEYLLDINRSFLKHDYYTDVITFDLSESSEIEGEIYISIDRVKENACQLEVSFKEELHRVVFHGALHLCGYRDKKKSDSLEMRKMEDKYLKAYFA